jgi:hypothetical protein
MLTYAMAAESCSLAPGAQVLLVLSPKTLQAEVLLTYADVCADVCMRTLLQVIARALRKHRYIQE